MVKKARPRNPKKILDLKEKILNNDYLQMAIGRIAYMLSEEILGLWTTIIDGIMTEAEEIQILHLIVEIEMKVLETGVIVPK